MKKWTYLCMAGLLLWILPVSSYGQFEDLKRQLENKNTLAEITATVEQFLLTLPESYEKERFTKHFNRWAYYWSLHLGPNGEFVHIGKKTLEALTSRTDAPLTSANGSWSFVGPSSSTLNNPDADINGIGRIDRIAFHPTNSNIIYIGATSGGLWKTTDGGTTWSSLSDYIPSLGISGIVIDHSDYNTIYVLTGDGDSDVATYFVTLSGYIRKSVGVLVSHDGGVNWEETGTMSAVDFTGYQLRQHPTDADILIAATSDGIYRTTNGGDTWVQERSGRHYDVEFKPGTPATVYATGPASFVYSTNTGDTWNTDATFNFPLCGGGRVEIAVTPNATNKVYLLAAPGYPGSNTFCGFYVSTNSGTSFSRSCTSPNVFGTETGGGSDQSKYDIGLAVHPTNDQHIIAAGLCTYKSTNGGSVFTNISTYREGGGNYIHPDIHMVAYNPLNNYLYAVGDGGVHRTTNEGSSWTDLYTGIETTQFYHMSDYDANSNAIIAGCQDNGVKYRTANTSNFSHIYCCDGADGVIDHTDQTKGYAAINNVIARYTNFTTTAPSFIRSGGFFMQIEMNVSNHNIVYIGDNWVYSYNASTGVTTLMDANARGHWAIKTCPSDANRLYTAGGSSAFATTGAMYTYNGTTWSTISGNPGFPSPFPRISDIGVEPDNASHVYATFSGYTIGKKVVYSADAGLNWTNISYDLPDLPVWSIEVDAANNVYVGCDIGVYFKAAGATHWDAFYNNLQNAPVSDLAINEGADQLLASTFGRGIWKSTLHTSCPADVSINTNVSGAYFRTASNSITMSGKVIGGAGTSAILRSEGYVTLTPGFQANADPGNKFSAYIGNCNDALPPSYAPGTPNISSELSGYQMTFHGNKGTLELKGTANQKNLIVRTYEAGKVRVLLGEERGKYLRDAANFEGAADIREFSLMTSDLSPGLYYLYLVVNEKVEHLQELEIK